MRKSVVAGALMALMSFPAAAQARPYLSVTEAKAAARSWTNQWVSGFTESPAQVTTRCKKVGRDRARCKVRAVGDRINARVTLVVREGPEDYFVTAYGLRVR